MRPAAIRNPAVIACCIGALALTAACGHHAKHPAAQPAPSTPSTSATPTPTPTPTPSTPAPAASPLTRLPGPNVFNTSPDQDSGAYSRDHSRKAPYNEYLDPKKVLADFPNSAPAKDIGFRFGDAPPGGTPTETATAKMPSASFTFTWNQAKGQYMVAIGG